VDTASRLGVGFSVSVEISKVGTVGARLPTVSVRVTYLCTLCSKKTNISVSSTMHSVESRVLLEYLPHVPVLDFSGTRERTLFNLT
jgi:hypothetical protein